MPTLAVENSAIRKMKKRREELRALVTQSRANGKRPLTQGGLAQKFGVSKSTIKTDLKAIGLCADGAPREST